jgi:DNA (cytosine-5)-methyltransferase 1
MIKVGSDFSGVGAFNQALIRLGVEYHEVFACDMDKYARQTFIHNYGEPDYYPTNVYDRIIPTEPLDIYMTSPPCQSFSLAGKRLGKEDKRGILFFNSLEFIQSNKPRYFIFENVKGLLSDNGGKTFSEWVNLLGGKSVNGNAMMFPYDDAVPYHLHWQVLNAKEHGVPQNRERVFLIGIRDDKDNTFRFPIEEPLTKRLKDVLEDEVNDKYFLSHKMLGYLENRSNNFNAGKINFKTENDSASCLTKSSGSIDISDNIICVGNTHPSGNGMNGNVFDAEGISPTLSTNKGEGIKIKSATSKGYEEAKEGDSINFSQPQSETRRGRVGKGVAQTSDTACNQATIDQHRIRRLTPRECFRLMDFPDSFTWTCSDSQAYKQAGNSIVVNVLYKIFKKLLRNNSQYI